MTLAEPFATAVTTPEALTVTTFTSDDDHVNDTPVNALPLLSLALAVNWVVSPKETRVSALGLTRMAGVSAPGSVVSSPQAQTTEHAATNATIFTRYRFMLSLIGFHG